MIPSTLFLGNRYTRKCRRKYCNPQQISRVLKLGHSTTADIGGHVLRSAEKQFHFNTDCFFCGKPAMVGRKRKSPDVFPVKTVEEKDTILTVCRERGDAWADAVQARILHVHDLHAADAVYHKVCSVNFRTKKQIPAAYEHDRSSSKRAKQVVHRTKKGQMHSWMLLVILKRMTMNKSLSLTLLAGT